MIHNVRRSLLLVAILSCLWTPLWARDKAELSPTEILWIEEHPIIQLAPDPSFAPIEYLEDGEYMGISSDFLKIIAERTGLNIEVLPIESWEEALSLLKTGRADINGAATSNASRNKYLIFTDSFFDSDILIFGTRENSTKIQIKDLIDKRVGITAGYAEDDYMALIHPNQELIRFTSMEEALKALSLGRLDYFIGDIAVIGFQKKNLGITNIVIAGTLDYRHSLSFAVRRDLPILRDIIQKGLDTISEAEREDIYEKWIGIKLENAYVSKAILPAIFAGTGFIVAILILILLWNRTLAKRIQEKTETINMELAAKKKRTEQLTRSNQEKELLLHEIQHRVNNNMQMILSLLSFDSADDPENRISVRTQSRINVVAKAQERSQIDIRVNHIETYSFAMDIIYGIGMIRNTDISRRIRLKETTLFCNLDTAVNLGLLFNEVLLNLCEYELFERGGCEINFSRLKDHSLELSILLSENVPSIEFLEGEKNSQTGVLIQNLIETLSAVTGISQFETAKGPKTRWNIIIPDFAPDRVEI